MLEGGREGGDDVPRRVVSNSRFEDLCKSICTDGFRERGGKRDGAVEREEVGRADMCGRDVLRARYTR